MAEMITHARRQQYLGERADTVFVRAYRPGQALKVCVAHGEGNYFADGETLRRLEGDGRIAFRYCDAGEPAAARGSWHHNDAGLRPPFSEVVPVGRGRRLNG